MSRTRQTTTAGFDGGEMTITELAERLERVEPDITVSFGFELPEKYYGTDTFFFIAKRDVSVGSMLECVKAAEKMVERWWCSPGMPWLIDTECAIDGPADDDTEVITPLLLGYMVGNPMKFLSAEG